MTATAPSALATIKGQPSETAKDLWVVLTFALKTYVAGLLALYVAFWLGLDEPRWALLTVYIVSQPESGLVLAKSFYRALGTAAGILISTLLVFTFAQYGELFLPSLALWTGICNFAARAVRNFTSYGFLLAGYTTAIVGIPAALNPNQAYATVVARGTEVIIGIAFAALASQLLFPQELIQRLVAVTRQVIVRVRQFGSAAINPATDKTAFDAQRIQLIQDLASIEPMRASAYFESAQARRLTEPVRQVAQAALTICAIAEDVAGRVASAPHCSIVSPWTAPTLLLKTNDTPAEDAAATSTLMSISDQRDIFDAEARLTAAEGRLEGKSDRTYPTGPLETWSDPIPAILTGVRTAFAVVVTWATWFVTAWPSGPTAIVVAVVVCSLIASIEQPVKISFALAAAILVATVPVFVTVFYLMPLASDFVSMAFAIAPLLLVCGFIIAQPKIGSLSLLTIVYFDVGSNIDNVMDYDTNQFFNTSLAVLFGIGVALVLFATVFPETPSQSLRLLRKQLRFRLSRFSADCESTLSSFAYALCDQLATTFTRVKDEPSAARECYALAMAAMSMGRAIDRLKSTLNASLPSQIKTEIETLLSRVSETLARPSRAGLVKRAWDARGVRMSILQEARATNKIKEATVLGRALIGCELLRANLLRARIFLNGTASCSVKLIS
jgi:uncharacterized membrane protein YccC